MPSSTATRTASAVTGLLTEARADRSERVAAGCDDAFGGRHPGGRERNVPFVDLLERPHLDGGYALSAGPIGCPHARRG